MSEVINETPLPARIAMAQQILAAKERAAAAATEEFLRRHPDWLARYGDKARVRGLEDAGYHIEFLAGAIESGSVDAYCDYARWCRRLLGRFGIASHFLSENLSQIGDALVARLGPAAAETIDDFTRLAVEACLDSPAEPVSASGAPLDATRSVFVQSILNGRRREALTIARGALDEGHTAMDVYAQIFQDGLYEIGRRWEKGQITVAQEHMATATVQYVIAQIYAVLPVSAQFRGSAIVTGVQGEFHQVGANIVADMLEADGWKVRFLGTNMPHRDILAAVRESEIDLLGISATMLFNLPHVRALVLEVRETLGSRAPRIVVGGGAFRLSAGFCADLNVEGPAADLRSVVRLCAA